MQRSQQAPLGCDLHDCRTDAFHRTLRMESRITAPIPALGVEVDAVGCPVVLAGSVRSACSSGRGLRVAITASLGAGIRASGTGRITGPGLQHFAGRIQLAKFSFGPLLQTRIVGESVGMPDRGEFAVSLVNLGACCPMRQFEHGIRFPHVHNQNLRLARFRLWCNQQKYIIQKPASTSFSGRPGVTGS